MMALVKPGLLRSVQIAANALIIKWISHVNGGIWRFRKQPVRGADKYLFWDGGGPGISSARLSAVWRRAYTGLPQHAQAGHMTRFMRNLSCAAGPSFRWFRASL